MKKIDYISLIKASQISAYSPDYLSSLIRKNKLGGKKIGRDWFTTKESLDVYTDSGKFLAVEAGSNRQVPDFYFSVRRKIKSLSLIMGFIFIAAIIVLPFFLLSRSSFLQIKEPGDFTEKVELQKKEIKVGESGSDFLNEAQSINITTYPSDDEGGIEISIEPGQENLPVKKE